MSEQPLDCAIVQFCQEEMATWEENNFSEVIKEAVYEAYEAVIEFVQKYNSNSPETI